VHLSNLEASSSFSLDVLRHIHLFVFLPPFAFPVESLRRALAGLQTQCGAFPIRCKLSIHVPYAHGLTPASFGALFRAPQFLAAFAVYPPQLAIDGELIYQPFFDDLEQPTLDDRVQLRAS